MLLDGKVAIVTGAGSPQGIGYGVARRFAREGARVALLDRSPRSAQELERELGPHAIAVMADVRDEAACAAAIAEVVARWGRLDVLVNNAGVVQARRTRDISRDDYDIVMDVNLRGTLHMSQQALAHMGPGGSIVCIASIAAQRGGGLMGGPHYAASKGGVLALVKSMAREFGPAGIRVNAVNPGVILTGMTAGAYEGERGASVISTIPLARLGTPDDVAGACLFLASDLSGYITGASVDVNGGLHMH